jgi:hypothetical protein
LSPNGLLAADGRTRQMRRACDRRFFRTPLDTLRRPPRTSL